MGFVTDVKIAAKGIMKRLTSEAKPERNTKQTLKRLKRKLANIALHILTKQRNIEIDAIMNIGRNVFKKVPTLAKDIEMKPLLLMGAISVLVVVRLSVNS